MSVSSLFFFTRREKTCRRNCGEHSGGGKRGGPCRYDCFLKGSFWAVALLATMFPCPTSEPPACISFFFCWCSSISCLHLFVSSLFHLCRSCLCTRTSLIHWHSRHHFNLTFFIFLKFLRFPRNQRSQQLHPQLHLQLQSKVSAYSYSTTSDLSPHFSCLVLSSCLLIPSNSSLDVSKLKWVIAF